MRTGSTPVRLRCTTFDRGMRGRTLRVAPGRRVMSVYMCLWTLNWIVMEHGASRKASRVLNFTSI